LPRDIGREEALDAGRLVVWDSGTGVGVAALDARLRVVVVVAGVLGTSFFESFLESFVGGRIGVEAFFGEDG
jgi:hypothetical protein